MPVSPAAFLDLLKHNASALPADERTALLSFAAGLDPDLSADAHTARLSRLLLEQETLERRQEGQPQRGITAQPMKLTTTPKP
jgi:hypothetical protein